MVKFYECTEPMIIDWISQEYIPHLTASFTDPQKRVSIGYLFAAFIIAIIWITVAKKQTFRRGFVLGLKKMIGLSIIWSKSSRADYKLLLINKALLILLSPFLVARLTVATAIFFYLKEIFPYGSGIFADSPIWIASVTYTVFLFLFDDFSRFAVHLGLHKIPILWAFHKTHHSAETLTPFTVFRAHPVESVIFSLRGTIVQSVAVSLFIFVFGTSIELLTIYGTSILLFAFNATGANLRHSHVPISYGKIEKFFMSPAQHQLHHSSAKQHHDKNFGVALSIWDNWAKTLHFSHGEMGLSFGVKSELYQNNHSLFSLYLRPFQEVIKYPKINSETKPREENVVFKKII